MVSNHYYEVSIKTHTFLEADDWAELESLIRDFLEISADDKTQGIEIEHVDSEYL